MSGYGEMAWFGSMESLMQYLDAVGADKDEHGAFKIYNCAITVGIGGDEAIVPKSTEFSVFGKRRSLADGLDTGPEGIMVMKF